MFAFSLSHKVSNMSNVHGTFLFCFSFFCSYLMVLFFFLLFSLRVVPRTRHACTKYMRWHKRDLGLRSKIIRILWSILYLWFERLLLLVLPPRVSFSFIMLMILFLFWSCLIIKFMIYTIMSTIFHIVQTDFKIWKAPKQL